MWDSETQLAEAKNKAHPGGPDGGLCLENRASFAALNVPVRAKDIVAVLLLFPLFSASPGTRDLFLIFRLDLHLAKL